MWDIKCIASALCFLTSNILFIVHGLIMMKGSDFTSNKPADGSDETFTASGTKISYTDSGAVELTRESFSFSAWKDLDPSYIRSRWEARDESRAMMITAALFGAIAWFWLMVPIIQAAWVLSRGGKRKVGAHMLLAGLAICGGIVELLAHLMIVGMTNSMFWLARDFNLGYWGSSEADGSNEADGTGWRVLEMIHIVARGISHWVDAFEGLALFGIVVLLFYSVAKEPKFKVQRSSSVIVSSETEGGAEDVNDGGGGVVLTEVDDGAASTSPPPQSAFGAVTTKVAIKPTFSKCFTWFGLFVGMLSLVDFLADVLRFLNWKIFGTIAMAMNALLGVVFLPIWLLCLARQLPEATMRYEREEKRAAILLNGRRDDEIEALKGEMS
mmetsp:Transcript_16761/g.30147  ORF Transcript_16761/g.30147 Transcript_16761/m.30147 type:complete len:384 (+) Transcript_16761:157-1308(+)